MLQNIVQMLFLFLKKKLFLIFVAKFLFFTLLKLINNTF